MNAILNLVSSLYRKFYLYYLGVSNWSVGYPSDKHGIKFSENGVLLQGWVKPFLNRTAHFQIIVKNSDNYEIVVPVNISRPDVTEIDKDLQPYYPGFKAWIPSVIRKFDIYIDKGFHRVKLCSVNTDSIKSAQKIVLEAQPFAIPGKNGWLYLGSDGNHSYLQALGMIYLTAKCRRDWGNYCKGLMELKKSNVKVGFLVAPCKERVLSQYYSFPVSKYGLLDQIEIPGDILVYPKKQLVDLGDLSYVKTDTHWSQKGSLCAFKELCLKLSIDNDLINATFEFDEWVTKNHIGDLGNKMSPPAQCTTMRNKASGTTAYKVFDNGLPNFGRVIVLKNNESAVINGKCLVFGSSSSYSILSYAIRIFSHITFVHSAGSIDRNMIQIENPDYIIAQSNERFMLVPASLDFDTLARKKMKNDSDEIDLDLLRKKEVIPSDIDEWNPLFKNLLIEK